MNPKRLEENTRKIYELRATRKFSVETYFAMSFVDLVVLKNVSKINGLVNSSRLVGADVKHPNSPSNKADKQSRQWQNEGNIGEVAH